LHRAARAEPHGHCSIHLCLLGFNGAGQLWRVDLRRPELELAAVSFPDLPPINNDHVLDPDGHHIYMSAMDGHIYRGALDGGDVVRMTIDDGVRHFLHGCRRTVPGWPTSGSPTCRTPAASR